MGRLITDALLGRNRREGLPPEDDEPAWLDSPMQVYRRTMAAAGVISALAPLSVNNALAVLRARAWATHRTADQVATEVLNDAMLPQEYQQES